MSTTPVPDRVDEQQPPRLASATALVLFSACCFGSIPILITLATQSGARLVDVLAWRYLIAAILLVIVGGGLAPIRGAGRRGLRVLVLAGGGQALIAFVSLSALRFIPAATLTFLFYTYPAWVAVISVLRRTERVTGRRIAALALSLAGIALMVGTPGAGGLHPLGALLALSSALLYAAYIPMIDQLGRGLPPATTAAFTSVGAAVILVAAAMFQGGLAVHFAPVGWLAVATLAIVSTVLAFIAFLRGLAVIGPVRTAIVSTIEPFWTGLLGSVVLGQHLSTGTLAGGLCIAAAVVLLQLARPAAAEPAPAA